MVTQLRSVSRATLAAMSRLRHTSVLPNTCRAGEGSSIVSGERGLVAGVRGLGCRHLEEKYEALSHIRTQEAGRLA
jgi:hypothetical protein